MSPRFSRFSLPLVLVALLVITRGFMLASPEWMADPDECLLGMMGLERWMGGPPNVFIWGQRYGLSLLEVEWMALCFGWFGPTATVLKASTLLFFVVGTLFFAAWVRRAHGTRAAWIVGLLTALCPALLHQSLKPYGGYATAFVFTHGALWLLSLDCRTAANRAARDVALAIACTVVALAQPLWLPIVLGLAWFRRGAADVWRVRFASAFCGLVFAFVIHRLASPDHVYHKPDLFAQTAPFEQLLWLPERLYVFFSGRYLYGQTLPSTTISTLTSAAWLALLAIALVHATICLLRRRASADSTGLPGVLAVLAYCGAVTGLTAVAYSSRYLTPLVDATLILAARLFDPALAAEFGRVARAGRAFAIAAVVGGLGCAIETARNPSQDSSLLHLTGADKRSLEATITDLRAAGVEHAFVIHGMLQWNLMFESRGEIITRYWWQIDRRMDFPQRVDAALREGKPTAIVGRELLDLVRIFAQSRGIEDRLVVHDERWYYILNPDEELVRAMNFRFPSP